MTTIVAVRIDGRDVAFDRVSSTLDLRHGRGSVDDGPLSSSAALELVKVSQPLLPNETTPVNGDFSDGLAGWDLSWGYSTARIVDGACELTKGATDPDSWNDGIYRLEWAWDGSALTFGARLKIPRGFWAYVQPGAYDAAHASTGPTPYIDVEGSGSWQTVALDWTPREDTVVVDIGVYCYPTNPKQNGVGEPVVGGPPGTIILVDDVVLAPVGRPFPTDSFRVGVELELDHSDGPAFRGRLTDATLDGDNLSLTAIGPLATITRRAAGRLGFPAQLWADRVRQAFAEAGALELLELEAGAWNPALAAVDADEKSTLGGVLQALVDDVGAAIADLPDGRVLVQTIDSRNPVAEAYRIPTDRYGLPSYADPGASITWTDETTRLTAPNGSTPWSTRAELYPMPFPLLVGERYRLVFGPSSFPPEAAPVIWFAEFGGAWTVSTPLPYYPSALEFTVPVDTVETYMGLSVIITGTLPAAPTSWVEWAPITIERLGIHADVMELPPETVLYAPAWTMVDDVANELELAWALGTIHARDESSVAKYEARPASLSTSLSAFDDAQRRALEFLSRRSIPDWLVSEATILARAPVSVGLPVQLSSLPASSPASTYIGVVEGWTDSIEADEWTTTLALSAPRLSGLGVRWRDPIAAWNEAGAATWHDPTSLTPGLAVLRSPLVHVHPDADPALANRGAPDA